MAIVAITIIALLTAGSLAYVLLPLLQAEPSPGSSRPGLGDPLQNEGMSANSQSVAEMSSRDELLDRRDAIYSVIKDAELDRDMGKLTQEDFEAVRNQYMTEAALILRQLDEFSPVATETAAAATDPGQEIEQAVADLRASGEGMATGTINPNVSPEMAETVRAELAPLLGNGNPTPDLTKRQEPEV